MISFWTRDQSHVALRVGASYSKWAPCVVWCLQVFCKTVETCISFVTWLHKTPSSRRHANLWWELFAVCRHPDKFGEHRHSDNKRKNASWKTWILQIRTTTDKLSYLISTRRENVITSKKYILRNRSQKLKNKLFFHFMTTFYHFVFKIEANWAKRVVKPILEIRNANVIIYVWFIHFRMKFRSMQCKNRLTLNVQNLQ